MKLCSYRSLAPNRAWVAAVTCAALVALAPLASAAEDDAAALSKDAGAGAGAAIASLVYAPVKLVYATGGLVVGGLAWAFSGGDSAVAKTVLTPSVGGDYVVTRDHLTGEREVEFFGRPPEYRVEPDRYAVPESTTSERPEIAAAPEGW